MSKTLNLKKTNKKKDYRKHYFVRVCSWVSCWVVRKKKDNSECVGLNLFYIYSVFMKNAAFVVSWNAFDAFSCFVLGNKFSYRQSWRYLFTATLSSASTLLWRHFSFTFHLKSFDSCLEFIKVLNCKDKDVGNNQVYILHTSLHKKKSKECYYQLFSMWWHFPF